MKLPAHVLFRKRWALLLWKPQGILDQALVTEIVNLYRRCGRERPQTVPPIRRLVGA